MASKIEKRGAGWSFRYRDELGQLRRSQTYARQSEARQAQAELIARITRARSARAEELAAEAGPLSEADEVEPEPQPAKLKAITFEELIPRFVQDLEADPERRSKTEIRSRVEGRVLTFFGVLQVGSVTEKEVEAFRKGLVGEGLSAQSVNHHLNGLAALFKFAVREGYRRRPPELRRVRIPKRGYNYLRPDELERFLAAAREVGRKVAELRESHKRPADRKVDDGFGFYLLFRFAVDTGLRKGELACLQWRDLDFDREMVTVARSFNGPTKSGDAREVPLGLSPGLIAELKAWRLRNRSEWVFPAQDGQRMLNSARIFAEHFAKVRDKAGIKPRLVLGEVHRLSFHDLRHTFATRYMGQPGASAWRLKQYLGHSSITTTERYAHHDEEAAKKDRGIFGRAVDQAASAPR